MLNSASTQYTRGEGTVVKCVVYNDVYYFTTEQVAYDKTILEDYEDYKKDNGITPYNNFLYEKDFR